MAPPTSQNWLTGRRFGIVIDAGSSGSRLQIYSWMDPKTLDKSHFDSLPHIEKGSRIAKDWQKKIEPGISSFAERPETVVDHLSPLLKHAREHIPPSQEAHTPIFLLATAGMRLLPLESQNALLRETCHFLRHHSHFRVGAPSESGPCGDSVRIISGKEEGVFGWISVNYLMGGFEGSPVAEGTHDGKTYGFLDMGGASAQIAFEPETIEGEAAKDLIDVRLRLVGGKELVHKVFTTTWLGFGSNQARARYTSRLITHYLEEHPDTKTHGMIEDPCLPKNLRLPTTINPSTGTGSASDQVDFVGTGSFPQCLASTLPTLEKSAPCPVHPHNCPFGGTPVPPISFAKSHFVGVSEYWYSSAQAFGLEGEWNYAKFEEHAKHWCGRDWKDVEKEVKSRFSTVLSSDAPANGLVDEIKKELSHLEMQCFKSAWVANVLHEGLNMPRTIDMHDESPQREKQKEKTRKKPLFQSVDTVNDMSISWTLGKIVLEASKDVPIRSVPKPQPPKHHSAETQTPSPYLYQPPTPDSTMLLFYLCGLVVFIAILWRTRRQLRSGWLQFIRILPFRHYNSTPYSRLEQGLMGSSKSKHSDLPSITTTWHSPTRANGKNREPLSSRASPSRTASLPTGLSSNNLNTGNLNAGVYAHTSSRPSTPSPAPGSVYLHEVNGNGVLTPRSRNASTLSLNLHGS